MRVYPHYRDSGVEWLGEVPEHWEVRPLKSVLARNEGGVWGGDPEDDEGTIVLRSTEQTVDGGWSIDDPARRVLSSQARREAVLAAGDLVVTKSSGSELHIGKTSLVTHREAQLEACFSNFMQRLRCLPTFNPRLAWFLLNSPVGRQQLVFGSNTTTGLANLNATILGDIVTPIPPLDEQHAIAAFLDRETERIDSLIAKKRLLMERLREYRTALITRTVTRGLPPAAARAAGLDPSPRLKPSGVEWLGEVPEHWEVIENRRLFKERDERSDDGAGELLTVSHITGVTRRADKPDVGMFMAETLEGYKVCHAGDLVINTMWAWMGATGTARETGLVSPSYNVYTPDERLLPRFVDMAYRSARYVLGITSESRGIWTSRLRLYPQQFLSLMTAVPPIEEQHAIAAHVDQIESESSRITETVAVAIERLREYRTALITAAVTGKIDVRETTRTGKAGLE